MIGYAGQTSRLSCRACHATLAMTAFFGDVQPLTSFLAVASSFLLAMTKHNAHLLIKHLFQPAFMNSFQALNNVGVQVGYVMFF